MRTVKHMESAPNKCVKRRNTVQKRLILDALKRLNGHASAGMVLREVQRIDPEIGRATVFRVLSSMADDGELQRLRFTDEDDRFDVTIFPHSHILCKSCGRVDDVWFDEEPDIISHIKDAAGFQIDSVTIEMKGLCHLCREKSDEVK